jgi:hypothetical protein
MRACPTTYIQNAARSSALSVAPVDNPRKYMKPNSIETTPSSK